MNVYLTSLVIVLNDDYRSVEFAALFANWRKTKNFIPPCYLLSMHININMFSHLNILLNKLSIQYSIWLIGKSNVNRCEFYNNEYTRKCEKSKRNLIAIELIETNWNKTCFSFPFGFKRKNSFKFLFFLPELLDHFSGKLYLNFMHGSINNTIHIWRKKKKKSLM